MVNKTFSISEALKYGWTQTKAHYAFFLVIGIIVFVITHLLDSMSKSDDVTVVVANLISIIFTLFINVGMVKVLLKIVNNSKPTHQEFFSITPQQFFRYLGCSILYGLLVLIGLVLLIIPGIIAIVRLQFGYYFLIEKDMGPVDALKASWDATRGHGMDLFLFVLMFAIINFIGAIFFGIGLIVTIPITMIATVFIYKKLTSAMIPQVTVVPLESTAPSNPEHSEPK